MESSGSNVVYDRLRLCQKCLKGSERLPYVAILDMVLHITPEANTFSEGECLPRWNEWCETAQHGPTVLRNHADL